MEEKSLKQIVLDQYKLGKIVFMTQDGLRTMNMEDILDQPVEGLLYDINRDLTTISMFTDDIKWVNDYALSSVVVELKSRLDKAIERLDSITSVEQSETTTQSSETPKKP